MLKLIPLKMELLDSGQPTWEILKLIIHAQYQITAIGIFAVIAISAIVIGTNWVFLQRRVSKIKSEMNIKMASLSEDTEKFKKEAGKEIQRLKGERDRIIMAIMAGRKRFERAVVWAGCGIEDFALVEEEDLRNSMINATIRYLKLCKDISKVNKQNLFERLDYIPDELSEKKEEIKELVNKLSEREVSKDEESEKDETQ